MMYDYSDIILLLQVKTWFSYVKTELSAAISSNEKKNLLPVLHKLNKKIEPIVFVAANRLSLADLVLFSFLQPVVASWKDEDTWTFDNISRWYDNIQHLKQVKPLVESIGFMKTFNRNPPAHEVKAEKEQKGQAKNPKGDADKPQQEKKQEKKPKEKKTPDNTKTAQEQKGQPSADASKPELFGRLSMCVGRIINVERHPNADALYKEEIDLGEGKTRQVVSGLVKFVPIEEMQNRLVVVLRNLKPALLREVVSEAMVICASNAKHTEVEILEPPEGSVPGDVITVEGETCEPDEAIDLSDKKNNIFKKLQEHLTTNNDLVAVFKGKELRSTKGTFKAKTLKNCHLG